MRRTLCAFALAVAPSFPLAARGQNVPPPAPQRSEVITAAREVIQKARYCALITIGDDGQPQARVVDPILPDSDLSVWIGTNPLTRKVGQIRKDPRVTLFYFDPAGPGYVTVLGTAELVNNAAEKAKHWKDEWASIYTGGRGSDDFLLIRVKPRRLEVVSYKAGLLGDPKTWLPTAIDIPQE
jgi:PPOX class probable F420-dependent enzyme